eukprot:XP_014772459.1 PREDICTED: dyslexia susceptibility 1 candidate gene 1 protein homolog [Octopus bimaculoides]
MPVLVKDYEWEETETNILIKVALKGIHSSKAGVLTSREYLKVNYRPFLFECFLREKVDNAASSVQLKNGEVVFLLLKLTPGLWTKLQSDIVGDKAAMKLVRDKAIEESQKEAEEAKNRRAETKRLNEKYALKKMMKIEDDMRERIHNIKEHEKQKATEEIEEWKAKQKLLAEQVLILLYILPKWLRKQAEATRIKEFMTKDLTEEEKNPLFLRDKGNKFFQDGNYLAAINIYTHAIQLDYKMPALYSNRAACHLKVKNYMKCIEDSSKALDLLMPPVPQNASSRCKAFVRRGTAFCKLELFVEGLQDYEAALKLDPNNEQLIKDAEEIRRVIQS